MYTKECRSIWFADDCDFWIHLIILFGASASSTVDLELRVGKITWYFWYFIYSTVFLLILSLLLYYYHRFDVGNRVVRDDSSPGGGGVGGSSPSAGGICFRAQPRGAASDFWRVGGDGIAVS